VLVTGATGFVGGHLLEQLSPGSEIVAWSRSAPPTELAGLARWQQLDLLDRDRVRDRLADVRPSVVYHCAGVTQVGKSWAEPAAPLASNVLATHYLLDGLRRLGSRTRVLIPGSAAIYAPSASPIHEASPLAPDSPYAFSKLAQETLGVRSVAEDGLDVIVTRSFNHTGPRQTADFVAPAMARQIALIARGALPPVLSVGNVDAQRDITDVRDVVRAYIALVEAGEPGAVYNVASGVGRSIRSIVEALSAEAGTAVRLEVDPSRLRPVDNPVLVGDSSRLRSVTGWTPAIPFTRTIRDLLDYWRAHARA
jgi:GDP-4-dehydro-6-deoxy-D-mannose reductase